MSITNFQKKVYNIVRGIGRGQTMTYREVAKLAGNPKAARAVGNVLNKNHDPSIPCHRVVRSNGSIGGYNRGSKLKLEILKKEGTVLKILKTKK